MKKINLILIIILSIISSGCTKEQSTNNNQENKYIIIDESRIYNYVNNNWRTLNQLNSNWQEFKIYNNSKYIGDYYFKSNNGIGYYFDKNYKSYEIKSNLAISKNSNASLFKFEEIPFNEEDYNISLKLLKKLKYNYNKGLTISRKVAVDINNDNKQEYIYTISNYSHKTKDTDMFYVIFLREKNKNKIIVNQSGTSEIRLYDIAYFINITNNTYSDIILKYTYTENTNYDIYQYRENSYQLAVTENALKIKQNTKINKVNPYTFTLIVITILIIALIGYKFFKNYSDKVNKV